MLVQRKELSNHIDQQTHASSISSKQTHKVPDATDQPTHALSTAGMGN